MQPVFIELTVESASHISKSINGTKIVLQINEIASLMPDPEGDGCLLVTSSSFPVLNADDNPVASENREYYVRESYEDIAELIEQNAKVVRVAMRPTMVAA